jgi:endonuclease YncB( thermonuclease family)
MRAFLIPGLMSALALAPALLPARAGAQVVSGPASASDGDSLAMTGFRIRLFGIDAPEADQTCRRGAAIWACGQDAKKQLADLIEGRTIDCEQRDTDAYGRIVATCRAGNVDLGETMVGAGLAVALPDFTEAYVAAEARARRNKLGLWGSDFDRPAAWRAAHPARAPVRQAADAGATAAASPRTWRNAQGCAIKGNHNRRGQWIYHLPGMPYYDRTRPEELFCTEAQAVAAGYRRAVVRP